MSTRAFNVRVMNERDIAQVVDWAQSEGWNPGLNDASIFRAADPEGFLIGMVDNKPVASISVVRYNEDFGFLGFYIVTPMYRGCGFGLKIWQAGMRYLEGCSVGLDGVVTQQSNYIKSGFSYAYGNQRHQGTGGGQCPPGVVAISDVPIEWVLAYDAPRFPAPRERFVRQWITQPGSYAFAVPTQAGIEGYVVVRPCRAGYKVGPLFADNADVADALFRAATSCVPNQAIFLDTPLPNSKALTLAKHHAMTPVFETARMYTGTAPDIAIDTVFGVTSFELG